MNNQLLLISGFSTMGKSASLRNIRNQEKWLYLNTESGKALPMKNKFQSFTITDPYQVYEAFDHGTNNNAIEGVVVDSLTFLMDMFESNYVLTASNTMKAWSSYQQFFKQLMQQKVPLFNKPTIFTAHVKDELDEKAMEIKTSVPIKGALKNNGVEAYFSSIMSAKNASLKDLEEYSNDLLNVTEDEEDLGYKYIFQTRPTKATVGERIRSPMGMFTKQQTFIDNDTQLVLDHLRNFYS